MFAKKGAATNGQDQTKLFEARLPGCGALTGAQAWAGQQNQPAQQNKMDMEHDHMNMGQQRSRQNGSSGGAFLPVQTPDVPDLPFELDNGMKVFHLDRRACETRVSSRERSESMGI